VPKAFKLNPANPALLPLHVTQLAGPHGIEYYVERCNTFGWGPSEWGWQVELALIEWCLERRRVTQTRAYVDNFYRLHPPGSDVRARAQLFFDSMGELGIPLHEEGTGTVFGALGWDFDLDPVDHPRGWPMVLKCRQDKLGFYRSRFCEWERCPSMTLKDIESAQGIAQFLATAFPAGAAYVAPLIALAKQAKAVAKKRGSASATVRVSDEARETLHFFAAMLAEWDGTCPLTCGFGPAAPPECYGWVDAATVEGHGCGGVFWDPDRCVLLGFARRWTPEELERAEAGLERVSTGCLESLGVLEWILTFVLLCERRRVLLCADNEAAVLAHRRTFSSSGPMRDALRTCRIEAGQQHVRLRLRQVEGARFNPIADALSHLRVEEAKCMARKLFGVELTMVPAGETVTAAAMVSMATRGRSA